MVFYFIFWVFVLFYFNFNFNSDVSVLDGGRHTLSTGKYVSYLGPSVDVRSSIGDNLELCGEFAGIIRAGRGAGGAARVVVPGLEDPLSFGSSLVFAASVKTSDDPLGTGGPHVDLDLGDPVKPWGVYVPPSAHLAVTLRLDSPPAKGVRLRCVTAGPHTIYFGMGITCHGLHFSDRTVSYIVTDCLAIDEVADRVDVEVRAFSNATGGEEVGQGPFILEFKFVGTVLVGFGPRGRGALEGFSPRDPGALGVLAPGGQGALGVLTPGDQGALGEVVASNRQELWQGLQAGFWQRFGGVFCGCWQYSNGDDVDV